MLKQSACGLCSLASLLSQGKAQRQGLRKQTHGWYRWRVTCVCGYIIVSPQAVSCVGCKSCWLLIAGSYFFQLSTWAAPSIAVPGATTVVLTWPRSLDVQEADGLYGPFEAGKTRIFCQLRVMWWPCRSEMTILSAYGTSCIWRKERPNVMRSRTMQTYIFDPQTLVVRSNSSWWNSPNLRHLALHISQKVHKVLYLIFCSHCVF